MKTGDRCFYPFAIVIIALWWALSPFSVQAQPDSATRTSFTTWAKIHAVPLQDSEPGTGTADLNPLKTLIGDARVVALGEPAHGMHETLLFRNRMFRFMVEQLGFTTLVLEAGFAESHRVADYIGGGPGNPEELAGDLTIGNASVDDIALFSWMREYNVNPEHKRKVKLYGMDMQVIGLPGDSTASHAALDQALAYLTRVDPASAKSIRSMLDPFLNRLSLAKYPLLSPEEHDKLSAALDDLISLFERQRIAFLRISATADYDWAYRNAIVARQTDRLVRLTPLDIPGQIAPDAWKAVNSRDAAMADNVKWILDREGVETRILVYAHNTHVKNAATKGGVWDAFAQPPNSTGQYLRSVLGNKLVIIGTSFPSVSPPQPQSLDVALAQVGLPRFLLDLRAVSGNAAVARWLEKERPMQANLMTFVTLPASTAFDALLFIDKVTPTPRVQKK